MNRTQSMCVHAGAELSVQYRNHVFWPLKSSGFMPWELTNWQRQAGHTEHLGEE